MGHKKQNIFNQFFDYFTQLRKKPDENLQSILKLFDRRRLDRA
jgi:hypothetical protein